ncbi:MAG: helix-turn-helix domain-containing protein [Acidimicrobiales bacterium]
MSTSEMLEATERQRTAAAEAAANLRVPAGHVLATLRNRLAYSTESAATALGITERHLLQIESGIRSATGVLIDAMAELYGVDPGELSTRGVAQRVASTLDSDKNVLWLGWLPVELDAVHDNEALLRSISRNIRSMRCLGETQPIYIRTTDLSLLAAVIDLDDPDLPSICMQHLRLTLMESMDLVTTLRSQPSAVARPFSVPSDADSRPAQRPATPAVSADA